MTDPRPVNPDRDNNPQIDPVDHPYEDDPFLVQAAIDAQTPGSLANQQTIQHLVECYLHEFINWRYEQDPNQKKFAEWLDEQMDVLAPILLGESKDYQPTPWNRPGNIDRFLKESLSYDGDTPRKVLTKFFRGIAAELVDLINDAQFLRTP